MRWGLPSIVASVFLTLSAAEFMLGKQLRRFVTWEVSNMRLPRVLPILLMVILAVFMQPVRAFAQADAAKPDAAKPDAPKPDAPKPDAAAPKPDAAAPKPDAAAPTPTEEAPVNADVKRSADDFFHYASIG